MKSKNSNKNSLLNESPDSIFARISVLLAGFPTDATTSNVEKYMKQIAPDNKCSIIKRKKYTIEDFRGFVFVHFDDLRHATDFNQKSHSYQGKQQDCKLLHNHDNFINESIDNTKNPIKVHIEEVPTGLTKEDLLDIFEKFGVIKELIIVTKENRAKNCVYITFDNHQSAKYCVDMKEFQLKDGDALQIFYAKPKFSSHMMQKIHPMLAKYQKKVQHGLMAYNPKEFSDLHNFILEKEAKTGIHTISGYSHLNSDENSDILSLCSKNNENQSKEENLATLYQKINKQDKNKKAKTKSTFNSPNLNNRRPAPTMSMQLDINRRPVPIMSMQLGIQNHKSSNYNKDSSEVTRLKGGLLSLSNQSKEKFDKLKEENTQKATKAKNYLKSKFTLKDLPSELKPKTNQYVVSNKNKLPEDYVTNNYQSYDKSNFQSHTTANSNQYINSDYNEITYNEHSYPRDFIDNYNMQNSVDHYNNGIQNELFSPISQEKTYYTGTYEDNQGSSNIIHHENNLHFMNNDAQNWNGGDQYHNAFPQQNNGYYQENCQDYQYPQQLSNDQTNYETQQQVQNYDNQNYQINCNNCYFYDFQNQQQSNFDTNHGQNATYYENQSVKNNTETSFNQMSHNNIQQNQNPQANHKNARDSYEPSQNNNYDQYGFYSYQMN